MKPRIEIVSQKKLIGKRLKMTFSDDKTAVLWTNFMRRRKEITNNLKSELISLQVYDQSYEFTKFNPHALFEKWAAVEVRDFGTIPDDMEAYTMPGGLYAVFLHKGAAITGPKTFRYIFGTWLPNSEYVLDTRPRFELLGDKFDILPSLKAGDSS